LKDVKYRELKRQEIDIDQVLIYHHQKRVVMMELVLQKLLKVENTVHRDRKYQQRQKIRLEPILSPYMPSSW
jgi:hypothetical protein